MPADREARESRSDLATMLAEMDGRLQRLQQELEAVALPIARRPAEQLRATRPVSDAPSHEADAFAHDLRAPSAQSAVAPPPSPAVTLEADAVTSAPRRPSRRITATSRAAMAPPIPTTAPETSAPETQDVPEPARPARGRTPAADAELASRLLPGAPRFAARPTPPPHAESATPEGVVRQTIQEAEEEARRVVDDARQRISEIGARTRALLEHSLNEPQGEPFPAPRRRRARTVKAARRAFEGTVVVEAGPFADVAQLGAFENALASIPNVADVYIRTFESNRAHFELQVTEPTALIVELQARAEDTLSVVAAGDGDLRLDIVRSGS
jgi:hypothetical protein